MVDFNVPVFFSQTLNELNKFCKNLKVPLFSEIRLVLTASKTAFKVTELGTLTLEWDLMLPHFHSISKCTNLHSISYFHSISKCTNLHSISY